MKLKSIALLILACASQLCFGQAVKIAKIENKTGQNFILHIGQKQYNVSAGKTLEDIDLGKLKKTGESKRKSKVPEWGLDRRGKVIKVGEREEEYVILNYGLTHEVKFVNTNSEKEYPLSSNIEMVQVYFPLLVVNLSFAGKRYQKKLTPQFVYYIELSITLAGKNLEQSKINIELKKQQ
ncbi:MAG: hypothetical protein WDZ41_04770 [Candidatus Babeliales bacterium]